mgnify:CR=1 FL=1
MQKFKDFTLKSSDERQITLSNLLTESKVWIMFYRGTF